MHVGLDLLFLLPGASGGRETYARELLSALRSARPDLRLTTFVNRDTAAAGPGFWQQADRTVVLSRVSPRSPVGWALGEVAALARAAARARVDVLHSPANFAPLHGAFARVLTLHDVLWRTHPELLTPAMRWGTELLVAPAARRAHRVVTVSEASRRAIASALRLPAEKVEVVPNGLRPPAPGSATAGRERLGAGERPVALSVASHLPHKHLGGLLDALARMAPADRPLVAMAGSGTDGGDLLERARRDGLEDDVRLLGAVDAAALEDLYAAADLLVTTTLEEGFGLPVLEAMARGVPVACSGLPALRELAGDAAAYFDPERPDDVAAVIREVLGDAARRQRMVERGRTRSAAFTWDATARRTLEAYEHAIAEAR